MRSALHGFLGTYMSRYSDHDGYWLFGFLPEWTGPLIVDLLQPAEGPSRNLVDMAANLARKKFLEQVQKVGLEASTVHEATLTLHRYAESRTASINGHSVAANAVEFTASVVMDTGKQFTCSRITLVSRHDPRIEYRSVREYPVQQVLQADAAAPRGLI